MHIFKFPVFHNSINSFYSYRADDGKLAIVVVCSGGGEPRSRRRSTTCRSRGAARCRRRRPRRRCHPLSARRPALLRLHGIADDAVHRCSGWCSRSRSRYRLSSFQFSGGSTGPTRVRCSQPSVASSRSRASPLLTERLEMAATHVGRANGGLGGQVLAFLGVSASSASATSASVLSLRSR